MGLRSHRWAAGALAGVVLAGCAESGGPGAPSADAVAMIGLDASVGAGDVAEGAQDAEEIGLDASEGAPDAEPLAPDAEPLAPDAEVLAPDAEPLAPDAAAAEDASTAGHPGWARYTIAAGAHVATVAQNGAPRLPLAGLVGVGARTYDFIFDLTALYILTNPTQPEDQLDWNKLPGLSDCGQLDLAQDGLMFAWRWRPDLTPPVLEIAHYANNDGVHLYPPAGLIALDEADLRDQPALHYELTITSTTYRFRVSGALARGAVDQSATLPRRCPQTNATATKWAGGFYFGGTSTAPHRINGWILEP